MGLVVSNPYMLFDEERHSLVVSGFIIEEEHDPK